MDQADDENIRAGGIPCIAPEQDLVGSMRQVVEETAPAGVSPPITARGIDFSVSLSAQDSKSLIAVKGSETLAVSLGYVPHCDSSRQNPHTVAHVHHIFLVSLPHRFCIAFWALTV